jgi:hypothetical protein
MMGGVGSPYNTLSQWLVRACVSARLEGRGSRPDNILRPVVPHSITHRIVALCSNINR